VGVGKRLCEQRRDSNAKAKPVCSNKNRFMRQDGVWLLCGWRCSRSYALAAYHRFGWANARVRIIPIEAWESVDPETQEGWIVGMLRKPSEGPGTGKPKGVPKASLLGKGTETLWEYLTASAYADGTKRERASMTLFWGDQGLTACLSDRDNQRTMFAQGDGLAELLEALEEAVASPDAVWRHQRNITGHSGRKKS